MRELESIFCGSPLELVTFDGYADVEEGDISFRDNALLKARALHAQLLAANVRAAVLADDSGLEVAALGGRPGVLSARYAGARATWEKRRRALLEEMRGISEGERGARFFCAMALVLADGETLVAEGAVDGRIAREERGLGGFGYDPIFLPDGSSGSFAEMGEERKNAISHRRGAAEALLAALRA